MDILKNVELSKKEQYNMILYNIVKMLIRRNLIDQKNLDIVHKKAVAALDDKLIINITTNKEDQQISIIFPPAGISTIKKVTDFEDYLKKNQHILKLVIINDINKKVLKQILAFDNAEVFWKDEFLEDIISKPIIPTHQILTLKEKNVFLKNYKPSELSVIFSTDMIARYYKMQIGDIIRIIRPSNTSGKSIFYRIVKEGSLDLMI